MYTYTDQSLQAQKKQLTTGLPAALYPGKSAHYFQNNRPGTVVQRKQGYFVDNRPRAVIQRMQVQALSNKPVSTLVLQKKGNRTGLPDQLKAGIENLSGYSMDDVKVHYNSDKPALLQAHAYAQGTEIHLATGQEKHLAHEAWHVVQQKQGRVRPVMQMKGKVDVNDDKGLENEADLMGAKALSGNGFEIKDLGINLINRSTALFKSKSIIQLEKKWWQRLCCGDLVSDSAEPAEPAVENAPQRGVIAPVPVANAVHAPIVNAQQNAVIPVPAPIVNQEPAPVVNAAIPAPVAAANQILAPVINAAVAAPVPLRRFQAPKSAASSSVMAASQAASSSVMPVHLNEYLYHSTRHVNLKSIKTKGFDRERIGTGATVLGSGSGRQIQPSHDNGRFWHFGTESKANAYRDTLSPAISIRVKKSYLQSNGSLKEDGGEFHYDGNVMPQGIEILTKKGWISLEKAEKGDISVYPDSYESGDEAFEFE